MGVECIPGCGQCCDPVWLLADAWDRMLARAVGDVEPGALGDGGRAERNLRDAVFVAEHWTRIGDTQTEVDGRTVRGVLLQCAMFDPATRLCTAHDSRPPICEGYPWYGGPPRPYAPLDPACQFNREARTALPIVAIT